MDRKEIVPTVNGVRGVKGQEVGFRVSTYYDIPLIPVKDIAITNDESSGGISDMLFLDTDHLWLSVMKPTQYFEDGIANETHSVLEPSETAHFTEQSVKLDVLSSRVKVRLPTSNEEKEKRRS